MLIEGASTACKIGRPLNRHITVHWERSGIADDRAAEATTAFLKYWREWLSAETAYLWARENGAGKGSHLHILAHIPAGRHWHGTRAMRWIARLAGKPYRPGAILTRRIKGAVAPGGPLYKANLARVLDYAMKGAEPGAAAALAIERQPGGRIIGKRCGTSRNIG